MYSCLLLTVYSLPSLRADGTATASVEVVQEPVTMTTSDRYGFLVVGERSRLEITLSSQKTKIGSVRRKNDGRRNENQSRTHETRFLLRPDE